MRLETALRTSEGAKAEAQVRISLTLDALGGRPAGGYLQSGRATTALRASVALTRIHARHRKPWWLVFTLPCVPGG